MSQAESFAKLYSRVGRNSRFAGAAFVILSIAFLVLSVYDQFIVFEVDSVLAFLVAVVLLFRDTGARVQPAVMGAMLLSSEKAIAELTSEAGGYTYLPLGASVEDVVVVPSRLAAQRPLAGNPHPPDGMMTPPGRALAILFFRESGLT